MGINHFAGKTVNLTKKKQRIEFGERERQGRRNNLLRLAMNLKVYLDIDGVLLTKNQKIPEGAEALILWLEENAQCFWLTTHCRGGENKAVRYLMQFYPERFRRFFERVSPTDWQDLKTEALPLGEEFVWLEDVPFEAERMVLREFGQEECLVLVGLEREGELMRVYDRFEIFTGLT